MSELELLKEELGWLLEEGANLGYTDAQFLEQRILLELDIEALEKKKKKKIGPP